MFFKDETGELQRESTYSILETLRQEGNRSVKRKMEYYNLDAIIAVDYRVNSYQATQFRIWATQTLKEFICAENSPLHIGLPRGCLDAIIELLATQGIRVVLRDERTAGCRISVEFRGIRFGNMIKH